MSPQFQNKNKRKSLPFVFVPSGGNSRSSRGGEPQLLPGDRGDVTLLRLQRPAHSAAGAVARMRSSSLGLVNHFPGLQTTVCGKTTEIRRSVGFGGQWRLSECAERGNILPVTQKGDQSGSERRSSAGLLLPLFPHPEKGRNVAPSYSGSACVKQAFEKVQVQNAHTQDALSLNSHRRLVCYNRPIRRIFSHRHLSSTQEISQVRLSESSVRVSNYPIRAILSPKGVQQMCGSSAVSVKEQRHQNILLHTRLSNMLTIARAGDQRLRGGSESPHGAWVHNQPGKEPLGTRTVYRVSGAQNRLHLLSYGTFRAEDRILHSLSFPFSAGESRAVPTLSPPPRPHGLGDIGGTFGAAYDERFSVVGRFSAAVPSPTSQSWCKNNAAVYRGSPALEEPDSSRCGGTSRGSVFQGDADHRCIPVRLGCNYDGQSSEWRLVTETRSESHKCAGAPRGAPSLTAFSAISPGTTCFSENRQLHCSCLYQPPGRHPFPAATQVSQGNNCVEQHSAPLPSANSRARNSEQGGGPPVQRKSTVRRMEASPTGGGADLAEIRPGCRRSLRLTRKHTVPSVFLPIRRRCATGRGCAGPSMAKNSAVCFPSPQPDLPNTDQSEGSGAVTDLNSSTVAIQTLDSRNHPASGGRAMATPHPQGPSVSGAWGDIPSPSRTGCSLGLARERWNLKAAGMPPKVIETIQNARASSTRSIYSSKWRVFEEWCHEKQIIPFQCSVVELLCFLQDLLDKRRAFSTIKVYLAAISACHVGFGDKPAGQHPLVCRFMRGARRTLPVSRPLVPLWDLSVVLDALSHHPFEPIGAVGLKFLSLKTTLLLALTTAKRVSELQALSIHPSCLQLAPGLTKARLRPNPAFVPKVLETSYRCSTVELLAFHPPPFSSETEQRLNTLCPVRALGTYLDRTAGFRKSDQLFVSWASPHKGRPLSRQRLAHWIVEAIALAYSCKGSQATSWALFRGVSVQDICAAASWATPHTFVRFYRLDVAQSSLAQAVLDSGASGST